MEQKQKIKYEDLSTPIKIAIITSYVMLTIYALAFLIGFITGIIGE